MRGRDKKRQGNNICNKIIVTIFHERREICNDDYDTGVRYMEKEFHNAGGENDTLPKYEYKCRRDDSWEVRNEARTAIIIKLV